MQIIPSKQIGIYIKNGIKLHVKHILSIHYLSENQEITTYCTKLKLQLDLHVHVHVHVHVCNLWSIHVKTDSNYETHFSVLTKST